MTTDAPDRAYDKTLIEQLVDIGNRARVAHLRTNVALREAGSPLTWEQVRILYAISCAAEPLPLSHIAAAAAIAPQSATSIIDRLVALGHVERISRADLATHSNEPVDRRVVLARLTPGGGVDLQAALAIISSALTHDPLLRRAVLTEATVPA